VLKINEPKWTIVRENEIIFGFFPDHFFNTRAEAFVCQMDLDANNVFNTRIAKVQIVEVNDLVATPE
jgi:hypothetical protein